MSKVDYEMAERNARIILDKLSNDEPIPEDITNNFITSLARMTIDRSEVGPNVKMLREVLNARYSYTNIHDLYGFNLGASYGATKLFRSIVDLTHPSHGIIKGLDNKNAYN